MHIIGTLDEVLNEEKRVIDSESGEGSDQDLAVDEDLTGDPKDLAGEIDLTDDKDLANAGSEKVSKLTSTYIYLVNARQNKLY